MAEEQLVTELTKAREDIGECFDRELRDLWDKQFELNKHLTTLSASTIVVLAAFINRATTTVTPEAHELFAISVFAMILAVVLGSCGMITIVSVRRSRSTSVGHVFEVIRQEELAIPLFLKRIEKLNQESSSATREMANELLKSLQTFEHDWQQSRDNWTKRRQNALSAAVSANYWDLVTRLLASAGLAAFVFGLLMLACLMCFGA